MRALLAILALTAPAKMPSLEDAFARHGPAIVGVRAGDVSATGFFVTSSGLLATVVPADTREVVVAIGGGGVRAATRVTSDDATGLALFVLTKQEGDDVWPALALAKEYAASQWLLGLSFDHAETHASPAIGGVRSRANDRLSLDLPCDAGTPVLVDDRVVAIVTKKVGKTASVAVDVKKLVALAEQVRPEKR